MSKITRYVDSLHDLPIWVSLPIFFFSIVVPVVCTILFFIFLVVTTSPWFMLLPVAIWVACAIRWWLKNK